MSILNTKHCVYATLGCCFLVFANHLGRHLDFLFLQTIHYAVFELAWSDEPEEDSKDNKRSELFASHTCIMLIFAIFSAICRPFLIFEYFKMLNDAKVASLGFFI